MEYHIIEGKHQGFTEQWETFFPHLVNFQLEKLH